MAETERSARGWNPSLTWGLLVLPAVAASILFLVAPLAVVVVNSLTVASADGLVFSLGNFGAVLLDGFQWEILLRTFRISLVTTLIALLLGYPAALYIYFSRSLWRRVFLFVVLSPLFVSVIVRTYGWIVLLGTNGALNSVLPAGLQMRLLRTETAIVIGLVHVYLPFMVLALHASMTRIDRNLLRSAATLGASNPRIFRGILLPLSLPGMLSGSMIVFALSMTAFSTPVLLGGAANKTTPFLIYQHNLVLSDWHLGSTIAVMLLIVTLAGTAVLKRAAEQATRRTAA